MGIKIEACLEPEHVGDGAAIMEWQGLPLDKEGGRTGGLSNPEHKG